MGSILRHDALLLVWSRLPTYGGQEGIIQIYDDEPRVDMIELQRCNDIGELCVVRDADPGICRRNTGIEAVGMSREGQATDRWQVCDGYRPKP
jgi:hypothetical protein